MNEKVGFCCKFKAPKSLSPKEIKELESSFNTKSTTLQAVKTLSKKDIIKKLEPIIHHNMESTKKLLNYTLSLPSDLHMLRLSSDLLPLKTHPLTSHVWSTPSIKSLIQDEFKDIGTFAKNNNIRIGFHPGQFCVLNSKDERVFKNSLDEFEYHVDMAEMMGYHKWHENGFFINLHTGGRDNGTQQLLKNLKHLSKTGKNLLTIENDEYSFGVDDFLRLKEKIALVLDIHHNWCKTGQYIQPNDPRVKEIIDSWRGIRPLMHYSISKEDLFKCDTNVLPDLELLKKQGLKITDIRGHSNDYWNKAATSGLILSYLNLILNLSAKIRIKLALNF